MQNQNSPFWVINGYWYSRIFVSKINKEKFNILNYIIMNKFWFTHVCIGLAMLAVVSCSKDNHDDIEQGKIEADIIGTWTASSGKYNLSLEITSSGYSFLLSEPGNGGVTDKGTYEILEDGKIFFVNKDTPLCMGGLQNGKLSITFVSPIMISMLGTAAAGNTVFTLSDEGDNGTEDGDGEGFLAIVNDSETNDIIEINLYDEKGAHRGADLDVLEPGYYFEYKFTPGTYTVNVIDSKNKSYESKSFKVAANKLTILVYDGTAIDVIAAGVDYFDLSKSSTNVTFQSVPTMVKVKKHNSALNEFINN